MSEVNEKKEELRWIEKNIEEIKRKQERLENSSPINIRMFLPVGLFLLFLGFSFAVSVYQGFYYQANPFLIGLSAILSVCLLFVGFISAKIGFDFLMILQTTESLVKRVKKLKKQLEKETADEPD